LREFLESKWGDLIGWEILHVGIAISVYGSIVGNAQLALVGGGLMNAGFVALKMRSTNGNNGQPKP